MAHGFGGGSEEVSPPGKSPWLVPGQAQPGLVDQGCGLEGLPQSLPSHFVRGQFPQFLIDQREQFIRSLRIAACVGFENASDVVDEKYYTSSSSTTPELRCGHAALD
jgi:hypothetical protein